MLVCVCVFLSVHVRVSVSDSFVDLACQSNCTCTQGPLCICEHWGVSL